MDDRTVDLIFAGSLESLPPVSSKIVRIFTSSTFTGIKPTILFVNIYANILCSLESKFHSLEIFNLKLELVQCHFML